MAQSETIAKLNEALSKAQAEMKTAFKNQTNPFFKSTFANLESVWDACRGPLTKHGLAVSQPTSIDSNGKIILKTILLHASGEWLDSELPINPVKNDPQSIGSAISYMKRFGLSALVGVATSDVEKGTKEIDEDDDGETAQGRGEFHESNVTTVAGTGWKFTEVTGAQVVELAKKASRPMPDVISWAQKKFKIDNLYQLTQSDYEILVAKLNVEIEKASVK